MIDNDCVFMLWENEYLEIRVYQIWEDLKNHKKDMKSYKDFIRAFFRLELDHLEKYLLDSYKEKFIGRFYILYLKNAEL